MRSRPLAFALILLASGSTVAVQAQTPQPVPPSPQQRQAVVDVAYALGEAHALHRACAGPKDNTWRGRMSRLLQVEAPDPAYRQRLMSSFNAGFVARKAEFPTCTVQSAEAERQAAARGRTLSRALAAGVSP